MADDVEKVYSTQHNLENANMLQVPFAVFDLRKLCQNIGFNIFDFDIQLIPMLHALSGHNNAYANVLIDHM